MFPSAAREYEYTRQAFPRVFAFVVGWVMIAGLMICAATVALGFARCANFFIATDPSVCASALIVAAIGVKHSARLTLLLSLVQVGALLFVIAIGIAHIGSANLMAGAGSIGVLNAAALVFFAFIQCCQR